MNRSTLFRTLPALLALSSIGFSAGCYAPGGSGFSTDTHTYASSSWYPYTITVQDTRTRENFWSIDVPVGQQLVLHIRKGDGIPDSSTPDLMEWEIMDSGELFGQLSNSVAIPTDIQIIQTLRPVPELPATMTGATPKAGE